MSLLDIVPVTHEIELQGNVYKVSPLTLGDMAEFENRAKKKHKEIKAEKLAFAKLAYPNELPVEIFKEINTPISEAEIDAEAGTLDGCAFLLWCALRQAQPDINEAHTKKLITVDKIKEVLAAIGFDDDDKEKNPPAPAASE